MELIYSELSTRYRQMETDKEQRAIQARRSDMEARFRNLQSDIFCQKRIIAELEMQGRKNTGARIALRLMKHEQELVLHELGHDPIAASRPRSDLRFAAKSCA